MPTKILNSPASTKFKLLSEDQNNVKNKKYIVRGVLQRADVRNQNGRIYPYRILKQVADKYNKVFVTEKRAYGELDHPNSNIVEAKNASHTITRMWWEGKELWGDIEVLDTPAGNIVKAIIDSGNQLGISSRGVGSEIDLNESTIQVAEDFELIAWDFVTNPSVHGAFMRKITESKETNIENKFLYREINEKINNILKSL
jgi:hypothetical protein